VLNPEILLLVFASFLVGGLAKGTVGLGLPLVAVTVLALPLGLREAIAVVLIPGVLTNIWQAFAGPYFRALLKRLWSFMLMCIIGTWLGANILSFASQEVLMTVLGTLIGLYALFSLSRPQISPPGRAEAVLAPLAGGLAGVFYGMSSIFLVPGIIFLQALGLKKDEMVQALGMVFILLNVSLLSALLEKGLYSLDTAILSLFALIPASIGVYLGQRIRNRISEELFRKVFFIALLIMGIYFVTSAQL
jgi:hypothetical protein